MLVAEFQSGQAPWSLIWLALFVLWLVLVVLIFGDIIRSDDMSGLAKAGWTLLVIVLPLLGVVLYLAVRGDGMSARRVAGPPGRYDSISQTMAGDPVRY